MKEFLINIAGLGNKVHEFHYAMEGSFFEHFGKEIISEGKLEAIVKLDKHETFLDAGISIRGTVSLICDRSLENFDFPINLETRILFKYAEREEEVSEEIIHITRETETIDMGQIIYEVVCTAVPMRKVHPKFKDDQESEENNLVYRTGNDQAETQDPRWEKLKQLKFK